MEKHGVVPDVIDTAPTDEAEVSVMRLHFFCSFQILFLVALCYKPGGYGFDSR
jgi:hypothetical protein